MNVHQLLSGAGPVDAVTAQALAYRERFRAWGWGGHDHAERIDPRMDSSVRPLRALHAQPDDLLLFHYSAYAPRLRPLLALPNRKLLVSHNVTPARWLWDFMPIVAVHCAVGRAQLPEFARAVDLAAGVSAYNAQELAEAGARATAVIGIIAEEDRLGPPGPSPGGPPEILFVGRLSPHKRHDEIIRAFALYRANRAPEARLRLVGEPISPRFEQRIRDLAEELAPGAVTIESGLDTRTLGERYRAAHAFLCLSEHEGFCVPLLEAFHFAVPVVARPTGGIPEVAGDAALLVEDRDPAVVAELLALTVEDGELRAELARRGRARLAVYAPDAIAGRLRDAVEQVMSRPRG